MSDSSSFYRWRLDETALGDISPQKALTLIEQCFYEAQRETFSRVPAPDGHARTEEELRRSTAASVRYAFAQVGERYEAPTGEALLKVVQVLARKAVAWGTPPDVIAFHQGQILRVLERLGVEVPRG